MKKSKVFIFLVVAILCVQTCVFAQDTSANITESAVEDTVQPRGVYLQGGTCTITPNKGYVWVSGYTDSYYPASELEVEINVLKEISDNVWLAVWTDSITDYNTDHAAYTRRKVYVESGYNYMVEAVHTVRHNGRTESTYSEAGVAYVW